MDVTLGAYLTLFAITAIAGAIQRLGGQGFGTITVGFAALLAPQHVPVAILLLGFVATVGGVGLDAPVGSGDGVSRRCS